MKSISTQEIGSLIRQQRKRLGVTQKDVALTAGTGIRFLVDLEKGKSTVQLGKVLQVLQTLGISLQLDSGNDEPLDTNK